MGVLHRAGGPWLDLRPEMVAVTSSRHSVLWVSFSGTVQLIAVVEGALTRVRQGSRWSPHPGDGWQLFVEEPYFATSCGFGDGSGYRSTPPLLVATVGGAADVASALDEARIWSRQLAADGHDLEGTPSGHPTGPCGALYCPRIVPGNALL